MSGDLESTLPLHHFAHGPPALLLSPGVSCGRSSSLSVSIKHWSPGPFRHFLLFGLRNSTFKHVSHHVYLVTIRLKEFSTGQSPPLPLQFLVKIQNYFSFTEGLLNSSYCFCYFFFKSHSQESLPGSLSWKTQIFSPFNVISLYFLYQLTRFSENTRQQWPPGQLAACSCQPDSTWRLWRAAVLFPMSESNLPETAHRFQP